MPFIDAAYEPGTELPDNWGICLYGQTNTHKTSAVATMPGHGLVADWPVGEGGTNVLSGLGPRIKTRPMLEWSDLNEAFWWFMNDNPKLPTKKQLTKKGEPPWESNDPRWNKVRYDWMAMDSTSAAQEVAKHVVIRDRLQGIPMDPHKLTWDEYEKWSNLMNEHIFKFKTIPGLKMIWIAQERKHDPRKEDGEKYGFIGPDVRDKVLAALNPSLMLIARFYIETIKGVDYYRQRILPTMEGNYRIIAKTRAPMNLPVPPVITKINLGSLLNYTLFSKGEPPEAVAKEVVPTISFAEDDTVQVPPANTTQGGA